MKPHAPLLDQQQSLALLSGATVGRIVYTAGALPAVLPARFRLDADGLVVRADGGEGLVRAVNGAVVAFEAGEIDAADGSGWTVTVLGTASVLPELTTAAPLGRGPLAIHITPDLVTGRRLAAAS